ncbi:MAG: hypothetical protein ABIJ56_23155, partial [Pseudomonadota bacterium]
MIILRKKIVTVLLIALSIMATMWIHSESADAQTQVKPYMLIVFDTSGSMAFDINGNYLWGDGTNDTWGTRQCCRGDSATGSRMYQCKTAIHQVVASTGDITFGLMKFPQYFVAGHRQMDWYCDNQTAYSWCEYGPWNWTGHDYLRYDGECSSSTLSDYLVVPFAEESSDDVLMWVDNREYSAAWTPISATERELRADGPTPLAWTVQRARTYFAGTVIPGDDMRDCRPYFAVVLGDGDESCDGNPGNAVRDLYTINWGGSTYHVRTYVIGYGTSNANLNQMADYGWDGIDNNVPATAFRADSTDEVARIFSDIIADTVLIETCNEIDDDCDCPGDTDGDTVVCDPGDDGVDEGWPLFCDLQGGPPV